MPFNSFLRVLPLAAGIVSAWPQHADGSSQSLLPFYRRSLPSVQEVESAGTLHVPQTHPRARGLPVVDEDETGVTLPVGLKRHLPQEDVPAGVFTLPVIHAAAPALVGRSVEVQLENRSDVAYYAQLEIGTPAQSVYAQLDTGSWELWVNPSCDELRSSADRTFCDAVGQYDPDESSSSGGGGETKKLNYGVGSAEIEYFTDNIALSDSASLESVQFGVASSTTDQFAGVLGIGYGKGVNTKYNNFIDELAEQGITDRRAFSIALGSKAEGGGVIAFGGVDTGKFTGRLASLPIIPSDSSPDGVARYWIELESISLTAPSGRNKEWDGTSMPVFLDTGATLTLLPPSVVEKIAADFGSDGQDSAGFYSVDCSLVDEPGTVDFAFDGVTVKVPYKEIIREFGGSNPSCYLGIAASEDYALLGDTFLRSAYVVFDLDSDTVFMAQYENCGSDVSSIKSSGDLDGLQGSCGESVGNEDGDEDDDAEEEEEAQEEEDEDEASETTTSVEDKTTTATEAATTTSKDDDDSLPVVTEAASTTSGTATADSTTMGTASRPSETGSSDDAGPDSATETDSDDGGDSASGDAEGAAGRLNLTFDWKSLLATSVGATVMMML